LTNLRANIDLFDLKTKFYSNFLQKSLSISDFLTIFAPAFGLFLQKVREALIKSRLRDRAKPAGATWRCLAGEFLGFFVSSKTLAGTAESNTIK